MALLFKKEYMNLTGSFPLGHKYFRCWFRLEQAKSGMEWKSEKHTSGQVYWMLSATVNEKNDGVAEIENKLTFQLHCFLEENQEALGDWQVEAEYAVFFCLEEFWRVRGNASFSEKSKSIKLNLSELPDDCTSFAVAVKIGVKSMKGFKQPTLCLFEKTAKTNVVLVVGGEKFHVEKKILIDASPVFETIFEEIRKKKEARVVTIHDADPQVFRTFLDCIHQQPFQIKCDTVEPLLKLSKRFKVNGTLRVKCGELLSTRMLEDSVAVRLADEYDFDQIIVKKLENMQSLEEVKKAFKDYRKFSDSTMRVLIRELARFL